MMGVLLQNQNPFAANFAYSVGALVLAVMLGVWIWQRRAGPTDEERRQTTSIEEALTKLGRIRPVYLAHHPAVEDVWSEAETRFGSQIPMARWRSALTRLRGLTRGRSVRCLQTTDADNDRLYLATVGGTMLAHRDRDELREDALTVLRALRVEDTPPATMSEWYARDIKEGRVDFERSVDRARGDCELRLQENLKRQGEIDIKELYRRLVHDDGFRYPPEVVGSKLDQLLDRDVRLHRDGTLRYQRY